MTVRVETVVELLQQSQSVIVDEQGNERTTADILAAGQQLAANFLAAGSGRHRPILRGVGV